MKNTALFAGIAMLALVSCKKEPLTESDMNGPASISLLSPDGGETFTAGDSIVVTWKTNNIADTVRIVAHIVNQSPDFGGTGDWLRLENEPIIFAGQEVHATRNDGIEVFALPDHSCKELYDKMDGTYHYGYGKSFYIQLYTLVFKDGKWVSGPVQPIDRTVGTFTIIPPPMFTGSH